MMGRESLGRHWTTRLSCPILIYCIMNIYLFPTELEAARFVRLRPSAHVVVSGVGMAATAATLAELARAGALEGRRVVLAGIAGAYDGRVAVGEVVEVTEECCLELPERFLRSYCVEAKTELRAVRSACVHRCVDGVADADVENMEGATLFAVAEALGFEAVEVRAISNRVGEPFAEWKVDEALEALTEILIKIEDNA